MKVSLLFSGFMFTTSLVFAQTSTTEPDKDGNALRPSFVPVKVGTFMMGSRGGFLFSEKDRDDDEVRHSVTLTKGFEIGTTEVTQLQWFNVMGFNPSYFKEEKRCPDSYMEKDGVSYCPSLPVEMVSYEDVKVFLEAYNKRAKEEGDSYTYRLPTEAEWEYAARGGTTTTYSFGDDPSNLGNYGWYSGNSGGQPRSVATRKPGPLGLYDVHGNVWEWVQDWYGGFTSRPVTDPKGPSGGLFRVVRGGGWFNHARNLRSAVRFYGRPEFHYNFVGFRLVRTPKN